MCTPTDLYDATFCPGDPEESADCNDAVVPDIPADTKAKLPPTTGRTYRTFVKGNIDNLSIRDMEGVPFRTIRALRTGEAKVTSVSEQNSRKDGFT